MRAKIWFRISAILLLLMAAGHTIGFMGFRGTTPESQAVRAQMDAVHFAMKPGGAETFYFGGFYVGFGLLISAFYLFTAWVAWRLGRESADVAGLGWPMVVLMAIGTGLAVRYFFVPPIVLSSIATITLAMGTIAARRAR